MPPKKRRAAPTNASSSAPKKQTKQDGQKAVSRDLSIPVDEGFTASHQPNVYLDEQGIIFDASLNQTNIKDNNNKFYRLQLLEDDVGYFTHTRWGRVGEFGQKKTMGPFNIDAAMKEFNQKFKEKTGLKWEGRNEDPKQGRYTFIEKSYVDDDDDDEQVKKDRERSPEEEEDTLPQVNSKLPVQVQELIKLIFNEHHFSAVLEHIGYNSDKLPLGKLGKSTVNKGFEHLKELGELIKSPNLAMTKYQVSYKEVIEDFSNRYYSTIPHVFGRLRAPPINNQDILKREVDMLDTLSDMEVANNIMRETTSKNKEGSVALLDRRFSELNMEEMTPLNRSSNEFKALRDYLINTTGHTHAIEYRLEDIFRIQRSGERERFVKSEFGDMKDSCKRLLWHGSRTTNYGGILSQGLRIAPPEAPSSGWAFGKGIYLADISTKSAGYCNSYESGGHSLLLLCEAELGDPMYELVTGDSAAQEQCEEAGCIATMGKGRTVPQAWKDAGSVHETLKGVLMPDPEKELGSQQLPSHSWLQYNEYICYRIEQVRLRYLFRVKM
ncbi:MAG: hypothetical protein M1831_000064 [Alyxoria varia]|nr:MAG: hypothetical protein M1831_000064 [Alyxoria varia]